MQRSLPADRQHFPVTFEELDEYIKQEYEYLDEIKGNATWAIYSRVSRVDPKFQGYSLEIQPDRAEEYARAQGATKVEIYSDPNKTGRNSRRKELQRLVRDVRSGRIKVVVVHRLDRLYRNLESILGFVRFLKRHKVGLISVTDNIDTKTRQGLQMLALLAVMAETAWCAISCAALPWQPSSSWASNLWSCRSMLYTFQLKAEQPCRSLNMMVGQFGVALILRLVFVFVGAGMLGFYLYQNASIAGREKALSTLVYSAFVLALVGEAIGRYIFYATHVRIGL